MNEALAHEAVFPHVHPHPQMSALEDIGLTLLFLGGLFAVGRVGTAVLRKAISHRQAKTRSTNQ